jgi:hypothetical protein
MPNLFDLPDFPGKGRVTQTSRRVRLMVVGAGLAAVAVGGVAVRKVARRGRGDEAGATADPIAETPTAPPGAEVKEPEVEAKAKSVQRAKDEPAKPAKATADSPKKADSPKPSKPKPSKPKPAETKAEPPQAGAKPPTTTGTDAPPKPAVEPGNISGDAEPHHALNNPVGDPDLTEYPDPFEKRDDPRDPADPDGEPFGEEPHPQTGSESTSEPPPAQDLEAGDRATPPRRDKLDE